jgi:hypothetical protein
MPTAHAPILGSATKCLVKAIGTPLTTGTGTSASLPGPVVRRPDSNGTWPLSNAPVRAAGCAQINGERALSFDVARQSPAGWVGRGSRRRDRLSSNGWPKSADRRANSGLQLSASGG